MLSKILGLVKQYQNSIFLASCFVLISIISFNLGKIQTLKKEPIQIKNEANIYQSLNENQAASIKTSAGQNKTDTRVVASKNSTGKLYHYTWCPGAKQIKEANRIWFNTAKEAELAGYTLAGNCN